MGPGLGEKAVGEAWWATDTTLDCTSGRQGQWQELGTERSQVPSESLALIISTCGSTVRVTLLRDAMAFPNISSSFPLMFILISGEIYLIS